MKMNRVIALMTAMLLTFSLTACAESSAAPELDGKTEYELLEVENEILLAHNELWEKVFLSMSKNVTDDVISSNYGDVLMSAVEGAKDQFTTEEYDMLKADAMRISEIEDKIAEISASDTSSQPAWILFTPVLAVSVNQANVVPISSTMHANNAKRLPRSAFLVFVLSFILCSSIFYNDVRCTPPVDF